MSEPRSEVPIGQFETLGLEIGRLVAEKNAAYGDSFARSGEVMRILYPAGVRPDQMDDALGVVRVVDKLFRVATDRDALGESPWRDIAGYGILGAKRAELRRREEMASASSEPGAIRYAEGCRT